jgi:hypothetical protein
MRTVTFSNPEVNRLLNERFVCTWYNQASSVFPAKPASPADKQPPVNDDYLQNFPDGSGGPNVKLFFCTPEGRIVHFIQGYYRPATFQAEARYALEVLSTVTQPGMAEGRLRAVLAARHAERRASWEAERRCLEAEPPDAEGRLAWNQRRALLAVLARNQEVTAERLLHDPKGYMVNEVHVIA